MPSLFACILPSAWTPSRKGHYPHTFDTLRATCAVCTKISPQGPRTLPRCARLGHDRDLRDSARPYHRSGREPALPRLVRTHLKAVAIHPRRECSRALCSL